MALTTRETRERNRAWDKWEARLNRASGTLQGLMILLFTVMSVLALLGQPINLPEYVVIASWFLLILALLGSARPIAKRSYVLGRKATQPSWSEFLATTAISIVAIGTLAIFWGQGTLYRIERGVMVWVYWLFSLLLMQLTGLFVGFVGLALIFTGFFFCCCCNCCCRGPWLDFFFGWHKRRQAALRERRLVKQAKALPQSPHQMLSRQKTQILGSAADMMSAAKDQKDDLKRRAKLALAASEIEVKGMDEVEPILDFVENKAQVCAPSSPLRRPNCRQIAYLMPPHSFAQCPNSASIPAARSHI